MIELFNRSKHFSLATLMYVLTLKKEKKIILHTFNKLEVLHHFKLLYVFFLAINNLSLTWQA